MSAQHTPRLRQVRNTQVHVNAVSAAAKQFHDWPCVTTINNMRIALDLAEKDFQRGDAAVGVRPDERRAAIAKATGSAS